jgi:hypothetical protein
MTLWARIVRMSDVYPPRWWWPVVNIYGGPEGLLSRTIYMTRIIIGLQIRTWRQIYIHIFHREDMDRDPHDHPFGFWTCPLNQGYYEEVYEHDAFNNGCWKTVHVPRWHWTYRPATHTHRVVSTDNGTWPLVTLVLREKNQRSWGFWCHSANPLNDRERARRHFVKHTTYGNFGIDQGQANVDGIDEACPGTSGRLYDASRPR